MPLTPPVAMTTSRIMVLLDLVAVGALWPAAVAMELATVPSPGRLMWVGWICFPAGYFVVLYALGLYRRDSLAKTRISLGRMPLAAGLGAAGSGGVMAMAGALLSQGSGPRFGQSSTTVMAFACFLVCGVTARLAFHQLRRCGVVRRRLLVVGAGRRAWDLAWMLRAEGRNLNYEVTFAHGPVLGELDPRLQDGSGGAIVSALEPDLLRTARTIRADQIVVAPDERRGMGMMDLLACKTAGFPIKQYLTFVEAETRRIDLKRMEVGWLLYSDGFSVSVLDRVLKRVLDVAVCITLLIPAAPLLLMAMAAIKLDDGGPVLYRQTRVTRGGRDFAITKLRTMAVDAEGSGAVWAAAKDHRITRIGAFLRRTRLDELPQLLSVIRGDMSLVGPRPERPGFVELLTASIPLYAERHLVKAGLTGWAQINYPYGASIDDARSKLSYDLYYVKHLSVFFDLQIILQTLRVVLWPGASVR